MDSKKIREVVENELLYLGVDPSIKGFQCITECILYYILNGKDFYHVSITKELYPAVAELLGTTKERIERNTRKTVEKCILNSGTFPAEICERNSGKVTNSTFIAYVLLEVKRKI